MCGRIITYANCLLIPQMLLAQNTIKAIKKLWKQQHRECGHGQVTRAHTTTISHGITFNFCLPVSTQRSGWQKDEDGVTRTFWPWPPSDFNMGTGWKILGTDPLHPFVQQDSQEDRMKQNHHTQKSHIKFVEINNRRPWYSIINVVTYLIVDEDHFIGVITGTWGEKKRKNIKIVLTTHTKIYILMIKIGITKQLKKEMLIFHHITTTYVKLTQQHSAGARLCEAKNTHRPKWSNLSGSFCSYAESNFLPLMLTLRPC